MNLHYSSKDDLIRKLLAIPEQYGFSRSAWWSREIPQGAKLIRKGNILISTYVNDYPVDELYEFKFDTEDNMVTSAGSKGLTNSGFNKANEGFIKEAVGMGMEITKLPVPSLSAAKNSGDPPELTIAIGTLDKIISDGEKAATVARSLYKEGMTAAEVVKETLARCGK